MCTISRSPVSVRLSQFGVLSKRLDGSSWFRHTGLLRSQRVCGNSGISKYRFFNFVQISGLFATARRSSTRVVHLVRQRWTFGVTNWRPSQPSAETRLFQSEQCSLIICDNIVRTTWKQECARRLTCFDGPSLCKNRVTQRGPP